MKKSNILILLSLFFVTFSVFYKLFLYGLFPIPGDLLVSFYFPWYSGGWESYNSWTTHKEFFGSDAIRQHIPWLKLAYEQLRSGQLPLWDPYIFSGNPLLANIQAFVFYPFNILFLILPTHLGWTALIMLQFFLGALFMFLFMRKIQVNIFGSLLSSFAFVFSSYFIYHLEINIIGQTIIWLPLLLFSFESIITRIRFRFFLLSTFSFFCVFLAGYSLIAVYVILISFGYFFVRFLNNKKLKKQLLVQIVSITTSFFLAQFQIIPLLELFRNSSLSLDHPRFNEFLLPFKNLITFFAQDFYGNPVTENFWSKLYGDGTPYIGIIPLFFVVYALFQYKDIRVKFFSIISIVAILFALPGPLSTFVKNASIPIISASTMIRLLIIPIFGMSVLAGFGFNSFLIKFTQKKDKEFCLTAKIFIFVYFLIWGYVLFFIFFSQNQELVANLKVSFRNLIIPSFTFGSFLILYYILSKKKLPSVFSILIICLSIAGFLYTTNKNLPFSKKEFLFPNHPLISYLKNNAQINRFYGIDTAYFGTNLSSYYQIYSPEGYAVLRNNRYAQLIAASFTGAIPKTYPRADASFPAEENGYRKRIFNLLGVKYFLDKNDLETKEWNPEPHRFPQDNVNLVWQRGNFKIYERIDSLPRYFQTTNYQVVNDNEIITKIYDNNFNLKTILLEENPTIEIIKSNQFSQPRLIKYSPNEITFQTNTDYNSLLFISDAYYPGWQSYIDGNKIDILRADYAFRAVPIPSGIHKVVFKYEPKSFYYGLYISFITLLIIMLTTFYFIKQKKF